MKCEQCAFYLVKSCVLGKIPEKCDSFLDRKELEIYRQRNKHKEHVVSLLFDGNDLRIIKATTWFEPNGTKTGWQIVNIPKNHIQTLISKLNKIHEKIT